MHTALLRSEKSQRDLAFKCKMQLLTSAFLHNETISAI